MKKQFQPTQFPLKSQPLMNKNIGCKIYPNPQETDRLSAIRSQLPTDHPLEIGFYTKAGGFDFQEDFISLLNKEFNAFQNRMVHLSTRTTLFPYDTSHDVWKTLLFEEVTLAKKLNMQYGIFHDSKWPPSVSREDDFIAIQAGRAKWLRENCDFPVYMENTFRGVEFYAKLFEAMDYALNFTFDIGHTQVWSADPYEAWFALLETLDAKGVKIHFHIHANNGLFDGHYAFTEYDAPESVAFIRKLLKRFPESNFILEIQKDFAKNIALLSADLLSE